MAIVFIISTLLLFVLLVGAKKDDKKQNISVWAVSIAFLILCIQTFVSGLFNLAGITINLVSISVFQFLLSGGCVYWIIRKGWQKYDISLIDHIGILVICYVVYTFAVGRYGTDLSTINFVSVDGGSHAYFAKEIAMTGKITMGRYFAAVITSFIMNIYESFYGEGSYMLYHGFIVAEVIFTLFSALLLWAVIRDRINEGKLKAIVPIVIAIIYWIGYPAYSTMFGFSYFTAGICILTALLFWLNRFIRQETAPLFIIFGLNMVLYGILVSYTLFVPSAFFGCFFAIMIGMWKKEKLRMVKWSNIFTMLKVFLIPTVFGMLYNYSDVQQTGGMNIEGGSYNDLYSNFVLLIPFVALGIYFLIKQKDSRYILPIFVVQLAFTGYLFYKAMQGEVSAYYYMKNNSFLWMLCWILTGEAIIYMMNKNRAALLFVFYFCGLIYMKDFGDPWIRKKNERFIGTNADWVFNVMSFNREFYNAGEATKISDLKTDLYEHISDLGKGKELAVIGSETDNIWCKVFSDCDVLFTYGTQEDFLSQISGDTRYVCAIYSGAYDACSEFIGNHETVYENGAGRIIALKPGE